MDYVWLVTDYGKYGIKKFKSTYEKQMCEKLTIFKFINTLQSNKPKLKYLKLNQITIKLIPTSLMHFPRLFLW